MSSRIRDEDGYEKRALMTADWEDLPAKETRLGSLGFWTLQVKDSLLLHCGDCLLNDDSE